MLVHLSGIIAALARIQSWSGWQSMSLDEVGKAVHSLHHRCFWSFAEEEQDQEVGTVAATWHVGCRS